MVSYRLHKYQSKGDVTLFDELPLSKEPMRVDMVVVKKNRDTVLDPPWAKIYRGYNTIECKSPADKAPSLDVFNKLIGYTHIHAAPKKIPISDMTATLICAGTPKKLLKTLKEDYDYEILEKYEGIYYIIEKGIAAEKRLAVQVVTQKSEPLLQAMDKKALDEATTEIVAKSVLAADGQASLGYWFKALNSANLKNILERMRRGMRNEKAFQEIMKSFGLSWEKGLREGMQKGVLKGRQEGMQKGVLKGRQEGMLKGRQEGMLKGRQEGMLKGRQEGMLKGRREGAREVIALLEKGYSLADAKKKLRLPITRTRTRRTRAKTGAAD